MNHCNCSHQFQGKLIVKENRWKSSSRGSEWAFFFCFPLPPGGDMEQICDLFVPNQNFCLISDLCAKFEHFRNLGSCKKQLKNKTKHQNNIVKLILFWRAVTQKQEDWIKNLQKTNYRDELLYNILWSQDNRTHGPRFLRFYFLLLICNTSAFTKHQTRLNKVRSLFRVSSSRALWPFISFDFFL